MSSGPDLDLVFAVLDPHERSALESLAATLGAGDWPALPGLRSVVLSVAARRLAADIGDRHSGLSATGALREACTALGFPDPGTAAASIARQVRRWRAEERGQSVRNGAAVA